VKLTPEHKRFDAEIAKAAIAGMRWHSMVPDKRVKVEVESGRVMLTGRLDLDCQHTCAEQSNSPLLAVRGVTNRITIKRRVSAMDLGTQITAALARQAVASAERL